MHVHTLTTSKAEAGERTVDGAITNLMEQFASIKVVTVEFHSNLKPDVIQEVRVYHCDR